MRTFYITSISILVFGLSGLASSAQARNLTYKYGFGYQQVYSNGFVADNGGGSSATQLNGMTATYSLAKDMQAGAYFGFERNFDAFMAGPTFRYDFQRLIHRDFSLWNHLNLFVQTALLIKAGRQTKTGLVLQVPDLGFEVFPFSNNDFSILSMAGLTVYLMEDNMIGITNGMFGDVGLRYYF